jgi:hypothetical protein
LKWLTCAEMAFDNELERRIIRREKSKVMSAQVKLRIEAPVNGGRNYNGPKVAKFLVG